MNRWIAAGVALTLSCAAASGGLIGLSPTTGGDFVPAPIQSPGEAFPLDFLALGLDAYPAPYTVASLFFSFDCEQSYSALKVKLDSDAMVYEYAPTGSFPIATMIRRHQLKRKDKGMTVKWGIRKDRMAACVVLLSALPLAVTGGCGDAKDDGEAGTDRQRNRSRPVAAVAPDDKAGSGLTVEQMLSLYREGEKDQAIEAFLAIDWSDPPVSPDSLFALSEQELKARSDSRELARKVMDDVLVPLRGIVKAVLAEAETAADRGDGAREKRCMEAVSGLADFMRSPERLESFRQFGKAVSQGIAGVQG